LDRSDLALLGQAVDGFDAALMVDRDTKGDV